MARSTNKPFVAAHIEHIAERWESEANLAALCAEYGVSYETMRAQLETHLGTARYRTISERHRDHLCFAKGVRFTQGNRLYRRRRRQGGPPSAPVGTITIWRKNKTRRRYLKIAPGYGPKVWRPVSQLLWEKLHGPIPKGFFVGYRDGNTLNDDPGNLHLVNRAENARTAVKRCDTWSRRLKISEVRGRQERQRRQAEIRAANLAAMRKDGGNAEEREE